MIYADTLKCRVLDLFVLGDLTTVTVVTWWFFLFQIAKDAKECVQECVSEFISFITSEYPLQKEK